MNVKDIIRITFIITRWWQLFFLSRFNIKQSLSNLFIAILINYSSLHSCSLTNVQKVIFNERKLDKIGWNHLFFVTFSASPILNYSFVFQRFIATSFIVSEIDNSFYLQSFEEVWQHFFSNTHSLLFNLHKEKSVFPIWSKTAQVRTTI